jgi:hypothetical protein
MSSAVIRYSHWYDLTRRSFAETREDVWRGQRHPTAARERVKPTGFRAPGYVVTDTLLDLLREARFAYDSSVFPCPADYEWDEGLVDRLPKVTVSVGASGDDAVLWLDDCEAIDMSADGETVLATRGIWRLTSGWHGLPDLPGGSTEVILRSLSGDGEVVFGNSGSALGMEMTRWVDEVPTGLDTLNWPYATNGDGTFAIGLTPPQELQNGPPDWDFDVFRWSEAEGLLVLDSFWDAVGTANVTNAPGSSFFSNGTGTSGLIGVDLSGNRETLRFEGDLITHASAEGSPDSLSRDGMVTALRKGYRLTQPTSVRSVSDFAVLDSPECATEPLDELDPKCNHVYQIMTGLDATGQHGVGVEEANAQPNIFFHWSQGEDARDLREFLQERGIMLDLPAGFSPRLARISADAHTILGSGHDQGDNKCFLVTF